MTNYERIKNMSVDEFVDEIMLNIPLDCDTCYIFGSWRNGQQLKEWLEEESSEWISVKDRVPANRAKVLICTRSKNGVRNIDIGYWGIDHFIHRCPAEVTHWMPLPALPKESDIK